VNWLLSAHAPPIYTNIYQLSKVETRNFTSQPTRCKVAGAKMAAAFPRISRLQRIFFPMFSTRRILSDKDMAVALLGGPITKFSDYRIRRIAITGEKQDLDG
jgi:hypothetical protein